MGVAFGSETVGFQSGGYAAARAACSLLRDGIFC